MLIAGLLLLEWLHGIEKAGLDSVSDEEKKIYRLIHDLLYEDAHDSPDELLTKRLIDVNYRCDALHIWGSIMSVISAMANGAVTSTLTRLCKDIVNGLAALVPPPSSVRSGDGMIT